MRFCTFILSLVILVLSFMPCADANGMSDVRMEQLSQNHEQGPRHNDECTPFCICACCQAPFFQVDAAPLAIVIATPTKPEYASYLAAPVMQVSSAIWQPPKK